MSNLIFFSFPHVQTGSFKSLVYLAGRRGSLRPWPSQKEPGWWVWGRSGSPSGWRPWSEGRSPGFPSPGTSSSSARWSPPQWGSCPLPSYPGTFDALKLKHKEVSDSWDKMWLFLYITKLLIWLTIELCSPQTDKFSQILLIKMEFTKKFNALYSSWNFIKSFFL